jgi:acetyltransferase-like isoleucine patch superfamily enzyme
MNLLVNVCHWAKTQSYYRLVFKSIGARTILRNPLLVSHPEYIQLGCRVSIRDGVRLEVIPRDGHTPELSVGDQTLIEQDVHIVCHHRVRIGANVSITARCAIVDVTHPIPDASWEGNMGSRIQDDEAEVIIEDGVFLGVGTVVLPNVRIGKGAVIGANSVVAKDIPPFAIAAGAPAKVLRIYRIEGATEGSKESSCE